MRHVPIDPKLFTGSRERLKKSLPPKSLAIVNANDVLPTNADGSLPLQPNSDLFYLTGIEQEESILLLAPDAHEPKHREILFLREPSARLKIWEGHKHSKDEAAQISGIKQVKWLSEFPVIFRILMCEQEQVWLNSNEHTRAHVEVETRDARFARECQRQFPLHTYHRLARLLHPLRVVKSAAEIERSRNLSSSRRRAFGECSSS